MDKQFQEFEDRYNAVDKRIISHIDKLSNMIFPEAEIQAVLRLDDKIDERAYELDGGDISVRREKVIATLSEEERTLLARKEDCRAHWSRMSRRRVYYFGKIIDIRRREIGRCIERKGMKVTLGELKQLISQERRHLFIFTANLIHDITALMDWTAFYDIHAPRTDDTVVTFYNKPRREA